jgi:hypothetical protein
VEPRVVGGCCLVLFPSNGFGHFPDAEKACFQKFSPKNFAIIGHFKNFRPKNLHLLDISKIFVQ